MQQVLSKYKRTYKCNVIQLCVNINVCLWLSHRIST